MAFLIFNFENNILLMTELYEKEKETFDIPGVLTVVTFQTSDN